FDGMSIGSHIGRSTTVAYVTPDRSTRPPTYSVRGYIVAANGDQINFSGGATFTTPTTARGTVYFMGGTGRFEDATGELDFIDEFTVNSDGSVIADHQTGTGFISY